MSEEGEVVVTEPVVTDPPATENEPAPQEEKPDSPPPTPEELEAQKKAEQVRKSKEGVDKAIQRRIDKAIRARYEAEAEARLLREQLQQERARQAPLVSKDPGMPKIEQFDNFDDYVTAKADYISEKKLTEREQRQAEERAQTERKKSVESWKSRVDNFTVDRPDFIDELDASPIARWTGHLLEALVESDAGPKLAAYLIDNPAEAEAIEEMSPRRAVLALGRIEERLAKPVEKKPTNAPAPLTPLGSSAKVTKDPSEMSQKEFEAWRKTIIKAR